MEPFANIELKLITTSRSNPRTHFDQTALTELSDSIARLGVLQPVLVRPSRAVGWEYVLVCGHRRFEAAKMAGLTSIPATVRDLTDAESLEVQVVENLQREGLHPLEEAEGYLALMKQHDYSAETIATKVGKSRAYVYQRMQLASLPEAAKQLMWKGEMNASLALLVARIPDEKLHAEAAEKILKGHPFWDGGKQQFLPLTVKQATELVQEEYMLELKGAPFNILDAQLVPAAGACATCPKRTGNAVDLFGDVGKRDMCTDPGCFAEKRDAAWAQEAVKAAAKLNGRKPVVLTIGQSEKSLVWAGSKYVPSFHYVAPGDALEGDKKERTCAQVVEAKAVEPPRSYLARHPKSGKAVELWKRSELAAVLNGGKTTAKSASAEKPSAPERDWELERLIDELAGRAFRVQGVEKLRALSDGQALRAIVDSVKAEDIAYHARECGIRLTSVKKATSEEVRAIAFMANQEASNEDMAKALGIDWDAIEKQARADALATREKAKAATAAKPAKSAKKAAR